MIIIYTHSKASHRTSDYLVSTIMCLVIRLRHMALYKRVLTD